MYFTVLYNIYTTLIIVTIKNIQKNKMIKKKVMNIIGNQKNDTLNLRN